MKKATISFMMIMILVTLTGTDIFSQQGRGFGPRGSGYGPANFDYGQGFRHNFRMLDLTDEQVTKLQEIRESHFESTKELHAELQKLRIDKRNLLSDKEKDMDAIYKSIDRQTDLQNKLMKLKVQHRKDMEDVLTDEQKEKIGTFYGQGRGTYRQGNFRGTCNGYGMGRGFGRGASKGYGYGAGRGYGARGGW
jgi:Spy/CpxP family protein refolding chaperone